MRRNTSIGKQWRIADLALISLFSAFIAVCAWITVPIPDIPFTMQLFGVFAALCVLGGQRGTVSILVYLLLGAVGAPVFSNFTGGPGALLGTTGGYLMGFLVAGLVYWLVTAVAGKTTLPVMIVALCLALVSCYAFGTAWFMAVYMKKAGKIGLAAVLLKCVVPYIIPDLCKMGLALAFTKVVKDRLKLPL